MVRGYHVYKDIWTAVVGEEFQCRREDGNRFDPFAMAVMRGGTVIGHVPRKISSVCLRRGGYITCRVTGSRRYSWDLAQGGLEVPCVLRFEGDDKRIAKAKVSYVLFFILVLKFYSCEIYEILPLTKISRYAVYYYDEDSPDWIASFDLERSTIRT